MRALITCLTMLPLCLAVPPALAKSAAEKDPDQVVCKREAKTNTRFPKKTCLTRAEWDRISTQHQRQAAETIERPLSNPVCTGSGC